MIFILDRSGSMCGLTDDTIGGFNSMINEQKEKEGTCLVSTVLFNDHSKVIHDRIEIKDVPEMTHKDYRPNGCTALIDAIGDAIHHIGIVHKYARPEDVPANTIFVITTDGMENSSRKYSSDDVKKMIERQREKYGWEFIFVGANIDAVETAKQYGIREDRAVNYHSDKIGTHVVYKNISKMAACVRDCGRVNDDWNDEINQDFLRRK